MADGIGTPYGPPLPSGPNNVALPPALVANEFGVLPTSTSTTVSPAALQYYRIPLFLLPIYQAAAIQYGVPWQILAAINEVETNYGQDLAVSSAGAIGWMQFLPQTWLQYGVDASDSGYADPYNPADAIFAAARYLRAAGAQSDLRAAIFAYNHSTAYVNSVLLRAELIASYPQSVVDALVGLTEGQTPVAGGSVIPGSVVPSPVAPAAVADSLAAASDPAAASKASTATSTKASTNSASSKTTKAKVASTQGSDPAATDASVSGPAASQPPAPTSPRFADITAPIGNPVVAVQDGRIVALGHSSYSGWYVVLRDVYGNVYTYASLGSIARTYPAPTVTAGSARTLQPAQQPAGTSKPTLPASAGVHPPITLQTHLAQVNPDLLAPVVGAAAAPAAGAVPVPTITAATDVKRAKASGAPIQQVRVYAHPKVVPASGRAASATGSGRTLKLAVGAIVPAGTTLGTMHARYRTATGYIRFAVQPSGDTRTVDPTPILASWHLLQEALHTQTAGGAGELVGATAGYAFLLSKAQLEQVVLNDPGISVYACGRRDIAAGAIDRRVLAVLAYLSRSGLEPTVSDLRCNDGESMAGASAAAHALGDGVQITAINGIEIAGHQGAGSITDTTIRALLALQGDFQPARITSLMTYPGSASTIAERSAADYIDILFAPSAPTVATTASAAGHGEHATTPAAAGAQASTDAGLTADQWDDLMSIVASLPTPAVATTPSSAAIVDPGTL